MNTKTEAKHTPTPLKIGREARITIPTEPGDDICTASIFAQHNNPETHLNIRITERGAVSIERVQATAERMVNSYNAHDALVEALQKFGEHRPECATNAPPEVGYVGCSCGLKAALKLAGVK